MVRRNLLPALLAALLVSSALGWQATSPANQQPTKTSPGNDPSGMYSFLREGEFVQVTVEDGRVSGYVSRFGDSDSDKGQFIDQFFDKASLNGDRLSFDTKTVHGVWYAFNGVITVTPGKQPGQENYRIIKGTLIQHLTDANHAERVNERAVEFRSFPQDLSKP